MTSRPRRRAGAISAMNIGETVEARPTPIPPMKRQTTKTTMWSERAHPAAEAMKRTPASMRVRRRPIASAIQTPASGPKGQPRMALPITMPVQVGESENWRSRKMIAPEMSERS